MGGGGAGGGTGIWTAGAVWMGLAGDYSPSLFIYTVCLFSVLMDSLYSSF